MTITRLTGELTPYSSALPASACAHTAPIYALPQPVYQLQVDLIICMDVTASPIRSKQRQGRTARHGEGKVVYLLCQGREEEKYAKQKELNRTLQQVGGAWLMWNCTEQWLFGWFAMFVCAWDCLCQSMHVSLAVVDW